MWPPSVEGPCHFGTTVKAQVKTFSLCHFSSPQVGWVERRLTGDTCSAIKHHWKEEERINLCLCCLSSQMSLVWLEILLSRNCQHISLPMADSELIPLFVLLARVAFSLPIGLLFSWSMGLLTFLLFPSSLCWREEWERDWLSVWLLAGVNLPHLFRFMWRKSSCVLRWQNSVVKVCESCVKSWLHLTSNLGFFPDYGKESGKWTGEWPLYSFNLTSSMRISHLCLIFAF